ncbi:MAG: transposase [Acidobacteriota bacterium]|nr:MAG: transposase [Acidobacteriota bacterium]
MEAEGGGRKALSTKSAPRYKARPARDRKIDPWLDYLRDQLESRPWIPASQLKTEIEQQGYQGCYETVKVACRKMRQQQQAYRRACVRIETRPGQEAQFDWKGPVSGLLPGTKVYFFRLVLGYSRFRITRVVTMQTLPAILGDLIDVLTILGGVPQRLVFDNFGAGVLKPRPNLKLHPFFADFCAHYGVEPAPALPIRRRERGRPKGRFAIWANPTSCIGPGRTWQSCSERSIWPTRNTMIMNIRRREQSRSSDSNGSALFCRRCRKFRSIRVFRKRGERSPTARSPIRARTTRSHGGWSAGA